MSSPATTESTGNRGRPGCCRASRLADAGSWADVARRTEALRERGVTPSLATIPGRRRRRQRRLHPDQAAAGRPSWASTRRTSTCRATASQADLHRAIAGLNEGPRPCTPMLVQYPVPAHLDYDAAPAHRRPPTRDVDGMHPLNLGRMSVGLPRPAALHAGRDRGAARVTTRSRSPDTRWSSWAGVRRSAGPLAMLLAQEAADRRTPR